MQFTPVKSQSAPQPFGSFNTAYCAHGVPRKPTDLSEQSGLCEPKTAAYRSQPGPILVRSIVEEAGLGGFIYLQGKSGRRYVFSSIESRQVQLYDHALIAVSNPRGQIVDMIHSQNINEAENRSFSDSKFYVHLLESKDEDGKETFIDLMNLS